MFREKKQILLRRQPSRLLLRKWKLYYYDRLIHQTSEYYFLNIHYCISEIKIINYRLLIAMLIVIVKIKKIFEENFRIIYI